MLARPEQPISAPATLADIARKELAAAGGSKSAAIAALTARIENEFVLREQIAEEAINMAIIATTGSAIRHERGAILQAVGAGREGVKALATGIMRTTLDMPLMDGTKLRDATSETLLTAIKHYRDQASRMTSMGNFLAVILTKLPKNKVVGDVLNDAAANDLWRKHCS